MATTVWSEFAMARTELRGTAINIRAQERQRLLIDRAAELLGKSRSDFMLEAACHEAENVLLDKRLFMLDARAFNAFQRCLDAPVKNNKALKAMLHHKSPWEK